MKTILIHPTYFPSIVQMAAIVQADNIVFEVSGNYQKQSYRSRAYIAHSNGKLLLSIPVKHSGGGNNIATKNVQVENAFPWQIQHWKSLESAYRTSPYFEYYEDELQPLFEMKSDYLLDFNFKCFETISDCLQLELNISKTKVFQKDVDNKTDYRYLVNAKKEQPQPLGIYTQVFHEKHGFISNISILDLLFNEGPNALNYLESQTLKPL